MPTNIYLAGPAAQAEGDTGTTPFIYTVTRDGDVSGAALVDYFLWHEQSDGLDVTGQTTGTVYFQAGETRKEIVIQVVGDTDSEPGEAFHVALSNARGGVIQQGDVRSTITNDDPAGGATFSFATTAVTGVEGDSGTRTFSYVVTRSGDLQNPASVKVLVAGSGANPASGSDAALTDRGFLFFQAGQTQATYTVGVFGDTLLESDETFTLTLAPGARDFVGAQPQAVGTILNDDTQPPPGASISVSGGGAQPEGDSGTTIFTFTATRSGDTSGRSLVDYFTWGEANVADFAGATGPNRPGGTLYFEPGETTKTIQIAVAGDTSFETDERFTLALSNPREAVIGAGSAEATILNDDPGGSQLTLSFGATSLAQAEGTQSNGSVTTFTFSLQLSGVSSSTVVADYVVSPRSDGIAAASGSDFVAPAGPGQYPSGTISIAAGQTTGSLILAVVADGMQEPDEGFTVTLSNVRGATLAGGPATGTILNGDGSTAQGQVLTADTPTRNLTGAGGNDTLNAGQGESRLTGGAGADHFVFARENWAPAHITDFAPGEDKIDVRGMLDAIGYTGSDPFADGYLSLIDDGAGGTKVLYDRDLSGPDPVWPNYIIQIERVAPSALKASDWIFQ